jgi:hypothetical protein
MNARIKHAATGVFIVLASGTPGICDPNANGVVIPELSVVGDEVAPVRLFANSGPSPDHLQPEEAEYPRQLSLDIHRGRIEGFVASYSKTTRIEDLVAAVRKVESESKTYPQLEKFGIWGWRNEKHRYAVQVAQSDQEEFGPQLVVVWLDRKSPFGEEAVDITRTLVDEAIESTKSDTKNRGD